MKIFSFIIIFIIFFNGCEKSFNPIETVSMKNLISGEVIEKTANGIQPCEGCSVKFISSMDSLIMITKSNGFFSFSLDYSVFSKLDSFRIKINKEDFTSVDTLIASISIYNSIEDSILMFYIYQYINYIPLKIGNSWKYNARYYTGDLYYYILQGEEIWEIVDINEDASIFQLKCLFNGEEIRGNHLNYSRDTTFYTDQETYYQLEISEGSLIKKSCINCQENVSVLNSFLEQSDISLRKKFKIYYPVSISDSIQINVYPESSPQHEKFIYTLKVNIGLVKLQYYWNDGSWGESIRYELINYDLD